MSKEKLQLQKELLAKENFRWVLNQSNQFLIKLLFKQNLEILRRWASSNQNAAMKTCILLMKYSQLAQCQMIQWMEMVKWEIFQKEFEEVKSILHVDECLAKTIFMKMRSNFKLLNKACHLNQKECETKTFSFQFPTYSLLKERWRMRVSKQSWRNNLIP